jgi:acyl carrier protein
MHPTTSMVGTPEMEILACINDVIRTISVKARDMVITAHSLLYEELALDSLDMVAVILRIQDHFQVEIDPDEITAMRRVEDIAASVNRQLRLAA